MMTASDTKDRLLHDQMIMIERQRKEIAALRRTVKELEEELDLEKRLVNELFREHTRMGGTAIRIEYSRIVNDGTPLVLCYEQIDNIDCSVLRAVR